MLHVCIPFHLQTDNKSLDMDDFDDIAVQNSDTKFNVSI